MPDMLICMHRSAGGSLVIVLWRQICAKLPGMYCGMVLIEASTRRWAFNTPGGVMGSQSSFSLTHSEHAISAQNQLQPNRCGYGCHYVLLKAPRVFAGSWSQPTLIHRPDLRGSLDVTGSVPAVNLCHRPPWEAAAPGAAAREPYGFQTAGDAQLGTTKRSHGAQLRPGSQKQLDRSGRDLRSNAGAFAQCGDIAIRRK